MYYLELTDLESVCDTIEALSGKVTGLSRLVDSLNASDQIRREEVLSILKSALTEAKVSIPNLISVRRIVAQHYARQIVEGYLSPYEGARKIWWELWTDCRELDELSAFAGLASEYEDDSSEAHRTEYEHDIIEEARALVIEGLKGGSNLNND